MSRRIAARPRAGRAPDGRGRGGAGRTAILRGAEGEAALHLPVGFPGALRQHQPPPVLRRTSAAGGSSSGRRWTSRRRTNSSSACAASSTTAPSRTTTTRCTRTTTFRGAPTSTATSSCGPRARGRSRAGPSRCPSRRARCSGTSTTSRPPARRSRTRTASARRPPSRSRPPGSTARSATATNRSWASARSSGDRERRAASRSRPRPRSGTWTCATWTRSTTGKTASSCGTATSRTSRSSSSLDLLVKLQFPVARLPVTLSLDFIHNFGAPGKIANAYEAGVTVGAVGTPRTWRAFFIYQYIGRDALVGAYNTDDWWWHTWAEGYRFGVSYTIFPMVYVQPAVVFQRRFDYAYWINRVTVDLVKMF